MISVSYGGGTNSTAMLIGMVKRGIKPDFILFADTGGEKPHTYEYIKMFSQWLKEKGFPEITTVRRVDKNGDVLELEQNCLNRNELPPVVYGYKTCSHKFKTQPVDKYLNNHPKCKEFWEIGGKIRRFIGFDADEPQRAKVFEEDKWYAEYPLIEWGWGRDE